jgi:hypothetical protein
MRAFGAARSTVDDHGAIKPAKVLKPDPSTPILTRYLSLI